MSDPRDEQGSSDEDEDRSPESTEGSDRDGRRSPADSGGSPPEEHGESTASGGDESPGTREERPWTDQPAQRREEGSTPDRDETEPPASGERPAGDPSRDGASGTADRERPSRNVATGQRGPGSPHDDRDGPAAGGRRQYLLDIASSILVVVAIGALLFATSGIWPPLVAIESGSMEPHIQQGDLVFVMAEERFPGSGAHAGSGVVSARVGRQTDYRMFEGYGDVIVYQPDGSERRTPIIHRAMFWVEEGENWYDRADAEYRGNADDCGEMNNCPAPYAGFITKGDNTESNGRYDQVMGITGPVKPAWVMGTAEVRVPLLGEIRLQSGQASEQPTNRSSQTLERLSAGS